MKPLQFCETDFGHQGPDARFVELDEEAKRMGKWNLPMFAACLVAVLFPLLLVGVGSLTVYLLRITP